MNSAAPAPPSRAVRIRDELCGAMAAIDGEELRAWATTSTSRIGTLLAQRGRSIAGIGKTIAQGVGQEVSAAWSVISQRESAGPLWHRWSAACRHKNQGSDRATVAAIDWLARLLRDPRGTASKFAALLAARAIVAGSSGSKDGALDLGRLFGNGEQHTPATPSILGGIALEALLMAFSDLVHAVHRHLPAQRDPAWDALEGRRANLADLAGRGHAPGIAWRLFVDAFTQPTTQQGGIVPGMPLTLHQQLAAADAAVEAAAESAADDAVERAAIDGETSEQRENDMMRRWIGIAVEP